MKLLAFEILKLKKSKVFLLINTLPILAIVITLLSFIFQMDQSNLEQNFFFFQTKSYVINNPFYVYQSRCFGMIFFIVFPLYIAALFSYSRFLDKKNNAFRLDASLRLSHYKLHFNKFLAIILFFGGFSILSYILLAATTYLLPLLNTRLIYSNFDTYIIYSGILYLKIIILSCPTLLFHYWLSLKLINPTINILIALLLVLITFGLYNETPYFLFIKGYSDSLLHFKLDILHLEKIDWKNLLFRVRYDLSGSLVLLTMICFIFIDLITNWWNKKIYHKRII